MSTKYFNRYDRERMMVLALLISRLPDIIDNFSKNIMDNKQRGRVKTAYKHLDYELGLIKKPLNQINVDYYLGDTDLSGNIKSAIRALYNNKLTKRERLKIAKFSVLREINDIKERIEDE